MLLHARAWDGKGIDGTLPRESVGPVLLLTKSTTKVLTIAGEMVMMLQAWSFHSMRSDERRLAIGRIKIVHNDIRFFYSCQQL